MPELTFTKEQCDKIANALTNFIVHVAGDKYAATPEEIAILPAMTEIILKHFSIKSTGYA